MTLRRMIALAVLVPGAMAGAPVVPTAAAGENELVLQLYNHTHLTITVTWRATPGRPLHSARLGPNESLPIRLLTPYDGPVRWVQAHVSFDSMPGPEYRPVTYWLPFGSPSYPAKYYLKRWDVGWPLFIVEDDAWEHS